MTFFVVFFLASVLLWLIMIVMMPSYEWAFDHYPHDSMAFWLSLYGWKVAIPVAVGAAVIVAFVNDVLLHRKH